MIYLARFHSYDCNVVISVIIYQICAYPNIDSTQLLHRGGKAVVLFLLDFFYQETRILTKLHETNWPFFPLASYISSLCQLELISKGQKLQTAKENCIRKKKVSGLWALSGCPESLTSGQINGGHECNYYIYCKGGQKHDQQKWVQLCGDPTSGQENPLKSVILGIPRP